jgi:hypothetical protein
MVQVRLVFQAKFGKAGDLLAAFREFGQLTMPSGIPVPTSVRLLTDLSGPFDTVVQELEFESLTAAEKSQAAMFADPQIHKFMQRVNDYIMSGYKEFYTIES